MYNILQYKKIFEADTSETQPAISGKKHSILLVITKEDQDTLLDLINNNSALTVFTRPAKIVNKSNPKETIKEINITLAIADSNNKNAQFPKIESTDASNTLISFLYPKQLANLQYIESDPLFIETNLKKGDPKSSIFLAIALFQKDKPVEVKKEEPKEKSKEVSFDKVEPTKKEIAVETGEFVGANPRKKEKKQKEVVIQSFDDFIKKG